MASNGWRPQNIKSGLSYIATFDFAQILELSLAYQSFIKVSDACKYQPEVQANCLSLRLSTAHPSLFIDQVGYIC